MRFLVFKLLFFLLISIPNAYCNKKPVITNKTTIVANEVKILKNKGIIVFTDKVECKNGTLKVNGDRMVVKYNISNKNLENKNIVKNVDIFGNVVVRDINITITGDNGNYNLENNIITVENNVIMNDTDVVIFGDKMTYNVLTGETDIIGIKKKKENPNGRVIIILDDIEELKERYKNE